MDDSGTGVLDAVPDPGFLFTPRGDFEYVNSPFEDQTGYALEDVEGQNLLECPLFPGEETETVSRHLLRCLKGEEVSFEVQVAASDGKVWDGEVHFRPLSEGDEVVEVVGGVGILRPRPEAETTVVEIPVEDWQVLAEVLPDITPLIDISCLLTPDHEFLSINEKAAAMHGIDPEELVGRTCYELVHDQDELIKECPCEETMETGEPAESDVFEENGRYYLAATAPIYGEDDDIEALAHTVRDITEQKEREQELRTFKQAAEHSGH